MTTIHDKKNVTTNKLYLIYDGDCLLCRNTAKPLKIKKAVGDLELLNARVAHPLVNEAKKLNYDLNEGILVKYHDQYYFGKDALHFLALVSSPSDLFNRMNGFIFKSKFLSSLCYPIFKLIRQSLLLLQGVSPITNKPAKTLAELIYGASAENLPAVLKNRYANRPFRQDKVVVTGTINITFSKVFSVVSPLFRLTGALVPYPAKNIPVTVEFTSSKNSNVVIMHRTFYYENRKPYHFTSRVIHINNNVVLEVMRFSLASRLIYFYDNEVITMDYGGYVFKLGKWLIPLPLGWFIGKFHAFEKKESDDSFSMAVIMIHPLFGKTFQYDGRMTLAKSTD